jgi:hypothetical protein
LQDTKELRKITGRHRDLFANLPTHLHYEHERPGQWRLRGSGGLEIQLSGAGDRGGLEELLGVLTMGRYGWWWLKPKEER